MKIQEENLSQGGLSGVAGKEAPAPRGGALKWSKESSSCQRLAAIQTGCEEQVRQPLRQLAVTIGGSSQVATYLAVIEDHG